mgnify:FL=1
MKLLITLDENYIKPCKVMLYSLFLNGTDSDTKVYLLHSGMPDEKINELKTLCAHFGASLNPIVMDKKLFENAPSSKRYPKEMYFRLLSPLVLPDTLDRALYLDPDILIINSLKDLWNTELNEKTFAAASHTGLTTMMNDVNYVRLKIENDYFNTGVMLIDLNKARKIVKKEDVFDCVRKREKDLLLPDQDVFNILYGKETLAVPDEVWNYDVRNYGKYKILSSGKFDLNGVMQNTSVLHFCGKNKPWKKNYTNRFKILYLHYMNRCDKLFKE